MAAVEKPNADQIAFENAVEALETQIANAGVHMTIDSSTRLAYAGELKKMADQLRHDATSGKSLGRMLPSRHKRRAISSWRSVVCEARQSVARLRRKLSLVEFCLTTWSHSTHNVCTARMQLFRASRFRKRIESIPLSLCRQESRMQAFQTQCRACPTQAGAFCSFL